MFLATALAAWIAAGCARLAAPAPVSAPVAVTPAPTTLSAAEPVIPDPTAEEPVTAGAWLSPGAIAPGSAAELRVRVRVAAGHYLHAAGAEPPFVPTSVEVTPSNVVKPLGDWEMTGGADANGHLSGTVEFRRRVRVAEGSAAGVHDLTCSLTFQACTPELCWPARVLKLTAPFTVNPAGAPARAAPSPGRTKETP
jgi:hypothetical protein